MKSLLLRSLLTTWLAACGTAQDRAEEAPQDDSPASGMGDAKSSAGNEGDASSADSGDAMAGESGGPGDATSGGSTGSSTSTSGGQTSAPSREFRAEVWADNWFAAYLGEALIKEDSVPITTERSFNAEKFTFRASYPFTLNFVLKDYKQNDSGLEYIGMPNQQMGDGGFIAQVSDVATGTRVLVSDATWRCMVVHRAPLNTDCADDSTPTQTCKYEVTAEPSGWKSGSFDASAWPTATVYTSQQVGPKDGFAEISWDPSAKFVWGDDLETVNTLLCTIRVAGP